ncbi:MAG TPA: hypothetical protein DCS87_11675 [Rheinheimera sp.]|nr:hypothetical protein [Rheinheimera sp.]
MKKVFIKTHLVGVDCEFLPNKEYDLPDADAASIVAAGCGVYVDPVQVADSGGGGVEPPADAVVEAAAPEVVEEAPQEVAAEAAPEVAEEAAPEVIAETEKAKKGKAK